MTKSALQIARAAYQPKLPKALKGTVKAAEGAATQSVADQEEIKKLFPNTYGMPLIKFETTDEVVNFPAMNVGVILSGGQAPGGHNVISGIFDGIKKLNKDSKLYGFILGPGGLVDHNYMELTAGHHMEDPNILFGPLSKTKIGKKIYLTDEKKVYVYKITKKTVVDETQVKWIDDVPGESLVTLVTCASGTEGEVNRIIIQGSLVSTETANKSNLKYF